MMTNQLPARTTILVLLLCSFLLAACVQPPPSKLTPAPMDSADTLPAEPILRIENGMHTAEVSSIDIDAGYRFLLTTSHDKTARIWDLATGHKSAIFRIPSGYGRVGMLESGAISPDAKTIAVGGWTGPVNGEKRIYIFDRESGQITTQLPGISSVILHLTFSKDGRYLAATTGKGGGLYVWNTGDWTQCFRDLEYGEETHWVDFDKNGRMVTASYDGFVRLYNQNFQLLTMRGIAGGLEPESIVFSEDGKLIAVGFNDSTKINVLSGNNLSYLYTPETGQIGKGSLGAVTWSSNNTNLYGGGKRDKNDLWQLLKWPSKGGQDCKKLHVTISDTLVALQPISGKKVVFASRDPAFGVIQANNQISWIKRSSSADFYGSPSNLLLSSDGSIVQLSLSEKEHKTILFSLTDKGANLTTENIKSAKVLAPKTNTSGLAITDWQHRNYRNYTPPRVNGKIIKLEKFESSWSVAIHSSGQGFVLGTDRFLRVYDNKGNLRWQRPVQTAWAVNISGNGKVVAAALRDGTIRWYNWQDGRKIMALFMQNGARDWVVWTPDGFYDHSPDGEKLIGFQINKGWNQIPNFVSIEQMYDSLYRPDIFVADFLADNLQYQKTTRKVEPKKAMKSGLPPKVTIELSEEKTEQESIRLKIHLTVGTGGLGQILYRVNGVTRLEEGEQRTAGGQQGQVFEKELSLEPGQNIIEVTAFNSSNEIESRPAQASVYRQTTANRHKEKPDLYVLAIGINKYRDQALKLEYPVDDAKAFAGSLRQSSKKLFSSTNVEFLLDTKVTRKNMATIFKSMAAKIKPGDVFVLYIAGHGLAVESNYYFLPWELLYKNEQSVVEGGISRENLQRFLAMIPANKAVILIDTCNAGAFSQVSSRGLNEKTAISKLIRATGRATIMASTETQAAYEGYKGHGVFTWTLIEALKGRADQKGNKDGIITINELAEFVMEEVPRITMEKWKYEQFPLQDLTGRSFPLGVTD